MAEKIGQFPRRNFLRGAAALAATRWFAASAVAKVPPSVPDSAWAYMGTYTGAPGTGGNGQGIELFEADLRTGRLLRRRSAEAADHTEISFGDVHMNRILARDVRGRRLHAS